MSDCPDWIKPGARAFYRPIIGCALKFIGTATENPWKLGDKKTWVTHLTMERDYVAWRRGMDYRVRAALCRDLEQVTVPEPVPVAKTCGNCKHWKLSEAWTLRRKESGLPDEGGNCAIVPAWAFDMEDFEESVDPGMTSRRGADCKCWEEK